MHLSRALTAKLAACILAVTAVITPSFAASVGTVVSDSGLNVRAEASAESQVFTTLSSGTQVDVLSTTGDGKWHKISSNGITGFVAGDYLKVTEEKIYGQVVAGPLNVRSGPSADAEKVDSLSVGTIVEIEELIGGAGGWYQIEGGYVSSAMWPRWMRRRPLLPARAVRSPSMPSSMWAIPMSTADPAPAALTAPAL